MMKGALMVVPCIVLLRSPEQRRDDGEGRPQPHTYGRNHRRVKDKLILF